VSAPLLAFVLTAVGYACALCPSLYWLDSGELAGASFELGVAHAPGHPLAMLIGRLFCFLPIGDIATRVGLGQLFCGAGAAALVAWLGVRVASPFVADERARNGLGLAAGLLYAGSYAAGFSAIRPEVYALSALLVLAVIAACIRFTDERDPRWLGIAGLVFGLGLTNHHYLTLLGAAPPAIALLVHRPDAALRRGLLLGALGTAAALLLYVYLPLRAAHDPVFDWGHATSLSSFYWTVSAQSFQKSAIASHEPSFPLLAGAVLGELTPIAPLLALGGLYVGLRRAPRLALALLLAFMGPVVACMLVSFDPGNPDAFGYLSTGIAALALLCVPLCAAIIDALPARARMPLAALVAMLALARSAIWLPAYSLASFADTRAIYREYVAHTPADALLMSSYFQTTFSLDYLRVVEGLRPDLVYLPRHTLDQPGKATTLLRRDPRLATFLSAGRPAYAAILDAPAGALIEYDLDLDDRLVARARTVDADGHDVEQQSRRFAIWQDYLFLHQSCRAGAPTAEVAQAAADLRAEAGNDTSMVDALLADCRSLREP
jgi:hypothetical protein